MAYVKVFRSGNSQEDKDFGLERALRTFKKQVVLEGVLGDLRKHAFYVPPSQKKRAKHKEAQKRLKRQSKRRIR
jgi:small subunit ribosomal protein S21